MNLFKSKLFLGAFILLAYVNIGVFGLLPLDHATEMPMVDCPYTQGNFSICEDSFAHISNWQQFSNVILPLLLIFSLLLLTLFLYLLNRNFFEPIFLKRRYYLDHDELGTYENKIIKWLALFENSPSLSYIRHS